MKQKPNAKEQKGRRQSSQPNTDTAGEEVPSQPVEAQQLPETVDDVNAVNPVQQTSESIATGGEAIHEAAELPIEVRVEPINADTEIPVQEPIIVAQPEEPKSKKKYIKLDDVETVKFDLPAEPEQSTESRLADIVSDIKAEDAMKQLRASLANISRQESTVGDGRDSSARPEGVKGLSAEAEFLEYSAKQTKSLFNKLRDQTDQIEGSIAVGESEVLHRDEIAFLAARHELAVIKLKDSHTVDYQKRKDALAATLVARRDRKKTKREARKSIRASKKRDQIIQQQEKAAHAAARIRETISEKRVAFDGLTQHLYAIHDKQRKNLIHAQERKFANEKLMVDLETRHLKSEVRSTLLKKSQVRQNHQGHLNKRINDNLREVQLLELRHAKDQFELEMVSFEQVNTKQISQENRIAQLKLKQMNEMHTEKEATLVKHETAKEEWLRAMHDKELRNLAKAQKNSLEKLILSQQSIMEAKKEATNSALSVIEPKLDLITSMATEEETNTEAEMLMEVADSITSASSADEVRIMTGKASIHEALQVLVMRHNAEMFALEADIQQDIMVCQENFEALKVKMHKDQKEECIALLRSQEKEISELKQVQDKEIQMEESMHDSEMKMLVERRILNSVLETVADGIINITPNGIVVRFNHAAELMFGYEASEVVGNNITMLMPNRIAVNHGGYMMSYLKTGVKKIIGIGRRVQALRKDGTEFPMHLSVSELKEDGEHLFTGIARDLTKEVEEEEKNKATDAAKQHQLKNLVAELDIAKAKASDLLSQMLPKSVSKQLLEGSKVEPQSFACVTVFFMDVVGFDTITTQIHPLGLVTLLNELYRTVDKVIETYDVYKVETVGDTYVCVSGLPATNTTHAGELATMALHILHEISKFKLKTHPDLSIKVRIGLNSGPVVAGVIGSKMPRYCLFGDTVNTASRMESNSEAMKIHASETTYALLKASNRFQCTERGEIEVKGKGKMKTYWVDSKRDFDPSTIILDK